MKASHEGLQTQFIFSAKNTVFKLSCSKKQIKLNQFFKKTLSHPLLAFSPIFTRWVNEQTKTTGTYITVGIERFLVEVIFEQLHRFHARSAAMQVRNRHFLVAVQHICHLSTVTKCLNYGKYHLHINIILVFFPSLEYLSCHTCPTQPIPESIFLALVCLTPISAHVVTCILPQSILMLSLRFLVKKKVCLHPSSHDTTHSDAVI